MARVDYIVKSLKTVTPAPYQARDKLQQACPELDAGNPVHINHPRMGYSALSVSISMLFSISLSAFPFGSQIPKIHGLHTKPDGEHCIFG
jgi:hypothetical protein